MSVAVYANMMLSASALAGSHKDFSQLQCAQDSPLVVPNLDVSMIEHVQMIHSLQMHACSAG